MAKLIINPTSGAKKEIPVSGRVISIGRDPSNDLVLSDSMVSRRHAILELRGEQYVLRDNNSSNGTLINGDKISSEHPVRDGDLISIGSCRLLFQMDSAAAGPATAAAPPAASAAAASPTPPIVSVPTPAAAGSDVLCASCGLPAASSDRFCRQCGKEILPVALRVVCPSCGTSVKAPANFCGTCGKSLPGERVPRLPPTQPLLREKLLEEGASPRSGSSAAVASGAKPREEIGRAAEPFALSAAAAGRGSGNGGTRTPVPGDMGRAAVAASPRQAGAARPAVRNAPRPAVGAAGGSQAAAGFWIRLAAYFIDSLIVSIPALAIMGVVVFLVFRGGAELDPSSLAPSVMILPLAVGNLLTFGLAFAYLLYFWGARGATPGKKLLGLKIVSARGESPIGYGRAALRILGYFLNSFTFGIGFLLIAFNEEKRGLHDRIADTRVVRDG